MKTINSRGLTLVKHFEGCQLRAYRDEVGVWTIGYGHTGLQHKDGTVHAGRVISQADAERLLAYDMHQFEARVNTFVKVPLTDDQFAALVAFDFNTGSLHKSTLLRLLNESKYKAAAGQFVRWNRAGGRVLRGLTRRRLSERNLFNGDADFLVTPAKMAALEKAGLA
jgi:lysozyme